MEPVVADEAKLAIVFTYFFFLFFFFFSALYFSPTSGNLPCVKICFPQYFGITRRYIQKKYFSYLIFIFLQRKKLIFGHFFYFLRPAFGHGSLDQPWSLEYILSLLLKLYNSASRFNFCFQGITNIVLLFVDLSLLMPGK